MSTSAKHTRLLRGALCTALLACLSWACHAQYGFAHFDTLGIRFDRSQPLSVRFKAADGHGTACMYDGRFDEVRVNASLMLDMARTTGADTLYADAYGHMANSCSQDVEPSCRHIPV